MQVDYGANSVSQYALAEAFRSGSYDRHLQELRSKLKERRDITLGLLQKYFSDIAEWNHPEGGFYIWLKLTVPIMTSRIFGLAIKENILINPGGIYSISDNQNIRISYAYCTMDEMSHSLAKLSEIIRSLLP